NNPLHNIPFHFRIASSAAIARQKFDSEPEWQYRAALACYRHAQNLSPQTASDAVCDRVNRVPVDFVSDFAGEMRGPAWHAFTGKCDSILGAQKRRQHGQGENRDKSFHLLS